MDRQEFQNDPKAKNKRVNFIALGIGTLIFLLVAGLSVYYLFIYDRENDYSMTKREFAALSDDDALLESAFLWSEKYCPILKGRETFSAAPLPIRNVLAMLHLDGEVQNGGFPQFYYNGYLDYDFDYVGAFRQAGLDNVADLAEQANACFLTVRHTMPEKGSIEAFSKWYEGNPLNEYDDRYMSFYEEIRRKIASYIRENIACFGD